MGIPSLESDLACFSESKEIQHPALARFGIP